MLEHREEVVVGSYRREMIMITENLQWSDNQQERFLFN